MNLSTLNNLNKHTTNLSFQNTHGKILYGMTNDYMFHAVLQSNNKVLGGLICSLLQLKENDIRSAVVSNPVKFGESVDDKEIQLDQWAALFKSETWEDLKMISANDKYLTEAAKTISQLLAEIALLKRGK